MGRKLWKSTWWQLVALTVGGGGGGPILVVRPIVCRAEPSSLAQLEPPGTLPDTTSVAVPVEVHQLLGKLSELRISTGGVRNRHLSGRLPDGGRRGILAKLSDRAFSVALRGVRAYARTFYGNFS